MPSYVTPKRATEYVFYTSLTSQANTKIFQVNPTIAAGDFKVSTDGSAETNLDTLPVVTPAGSKRVKVTVSVAEMTGDNIQITASDATGDEWADSTFNLQTTLQQIDDLGTEAKQDTIISDVAINLTAISDIQNNTGFDSSPPPQIVTPESGNVPIKINVGLFDTAGAPQIPDSQDGAPQVAILIRAVSGGVNKTDFYDDEALTVAATASTAYSGYLKMDELAGAGLFATYYKLPSGEADDQWAIEYKYKVGGQEFIRNRNITIVDSLHENVTLADNATNATVISDATWDEVLDNSLSAKSLMRLIGAATLGKVSGMESLAPIFKGADGAQNRITATVDANGNRLTVTLDAS